MSILSALFEARGTHQPRKCVDPLLLKIHGAEIIEPTTIEPDPRSYRLGHYYNAKTNTLYRRVKVNSEIYKWVPISE